MSNFQSLIREIESYLNRVNDWDDIWNEHLLYKSSLENWNREQELIYLQSQELEFRRRGEELLNTVLTQMSEMTNFERDQKFHYRLSEEDKSNLLSVDLDNNWINSDTFGFLYKEGLCDEKLRCIFDDLEDEVIQESGTFVFDTFVFYNPEIGSWLIKWKEIITNRYQGTRSKESSSPESIL